MQTFGTNKAQGLVYLAAVAPGVAVAVLVLTLVVEAIDLGIRGAVNVQIELSGRLPEGVQTECSSQFGVFTQPACWPV